MQYQHSADAGQAIYSRPVLSIYDLWVLGFSNRFLWKCPTAVLRQQFSEHASDNHLDVGVGTGYYLDKCLSDGKRRVALLDLNPNSLVATAKRIRRFKPETYRANVLEKLSLDCTGFDSISINYLLHCLPGTLTEKSVVFANLLPYLNDGGVLFGSTLLGQGVEKGAVATRLMNVYNRKGIFGNLRDSLNELNRQLQRYFGKVEIQTVGCAAVFACRRS